MFLTSCCRDENMDSLAESEVDALSKKTRRIVYVVSAITAVEAILGIVILVLLFIPVSKIEETSTDGPTKIPITDKDFMGFFYGVAAYWISSIESEGYKAWFGYSISLEVIWLLSLIGMFFVVYRAELLNFKYMLPWCFVSLTISISDLAATALFIYKLFDPGDNAAPPPFDKENDFFETMQYIFIPLFCSKIGIVWILNLVCIFKVMHCYNEFKDREDERGIVRRDSYELKRFGDVSRYNSPIKAFGNDKERGDYDNYGYSDSENSPEMSRVNKEKDEKIDYQPENRKAKKKEDKKNKKRNERNRAENDIDKDDYSRDEFKSNSQSKNGKEKLKNNLHYYLGEGEDETPDTARKWENREDDHQQFENYDRKPHGILKKRSSYPSDPDRDNPGNKSLSRSSPYDRDYPEEVHTPQFISRDRKHQEEIHPRSRDKKYQDEIRPSRTRDRDYEDQHRPPRTRERVYPEEIYPPRSRNSDYQEENRPSRSRDRDYPEENRAFPVRNYPEDSYQVPEVDYYDREPRRNAGKQPEERSRYVKNRQRSPSPTNRKPNKKSERRNTGYFADEFPIRNPITSPANRDYPEEKWQESVPRYPYTNQDLKNYSIPRIRL